MTDTFTPPEPTRLPSTHEVLHWLKSLDRVPRTPPPVNMRDDVPANGELLVTWKGNGHALVFRGNADFVTRWFNWAVNTRMVCGEDNLHRFIDEDNGAYGYICIREREDIKRGLAEQFRWEIVRDREVPLLRDEIDLETEEPVIEYDEVTIERLAQARAEAFYTDHIRVDTMVLQQSRQLGPVYDEVPRENWRTGTED